MATPDASHAVVFLSAQEVAERLGLTIAQFRQHRRIPAADVVIGQTSVRPIYGWKPSTVDRWYDQTYGVSQR